jgi:hypothetical protein
VEVRLGTLKKAGRTRLLPLVQGYSLFNPHATIAVTHGPDVHAFTRRSETWKKWRPIDPTSPHWYTVEQLRTLIAAYVHAEQHGGRRQLRPSRLAPDQRMLLVERGRRFRSVRKKDGVNEGLAKPDSTIGR